VLASDGCGDLGGQEPGQRDRPRLVRLGRTQDDTAAHIEEGTTDIDPAAVEVDVTDAQGGGLAPTQAGVGQQQDQQTPASSFGGEPEDLTVSEVDVIAALWPGQAQAPGGIGADTAVASAEPRNARIRRNPRFGLSQIS
jgi:hypothetical protein